MSWKMQDMTNRTLIGGTLNLEHLFPFFRTLLAQLDPDKVQGYSEDLYSVPTEDWVDEVNELMDDLERLAPEGYYFGAHPGDGSDFGFWSTALLDY
jgi:hypothetical protein